MVKYSSLSICVIFAAVLLLSCYSKPAGQVQASVSDSTAVAVYTPQVDSLLNEFKGDSLKLLGSRVVKSAGGENEVQVVLIDYSINAKVYDDMKDLSATEFGTFSAQLPDSGIVPELNPFPALKGVYSQVFFYKGRLVTCDADDEGGEESSLISIISDTCFTDVYQVPCVEVYQSGQSNGNVTTYICRQVINPANYDTITIKTLNPATDLQLWSYHRANNYNRCQLKMPLAKTVGLPMLIARNNLGAGEDDFFIALDKVNYDSLLTAK